MTSAVFTKTTCGSYRSSESTRRHVRHCKPDFSDPLRDCWRFLFSSNVVRLIYLFQNPGKQPQLARTSSSDSAVRHSAKLLRYHNGNCSQDMTSSIAAIPPASDGHSPGNVISTAFPRAWDSPDAVAVSGIGSLPSFSGCTPEPEAR